MSNNSGEPPAGGSLRGRAAIVTGGASGIGRATCVALAREGANVMAVDVSREGLEATLDRLRTVDPREDAHGVLELDVRSEADMEAMARETLARHGRIDILVASAGILRGSGCRPRPLAMVSVEEWDQVIETNLRGMFLSNRSVLPAMLKQRSGNIVNVSSVSGKQGRAYDAPYCASKFGVIGMSESLAEEVRGSGIRVQIVCPDAIDTPMWDQNGPVPRPPNALAAERVADLVVYLVTLPPDTILPSLTVAPFQSRRGVGRRHQKRESGTG